MKLSPLTAIVDVDAAARAGWRPVDLAAAFLNGGATLLQLRAKNLAGAAFLDLAAQIADRAHAGDARLVVNDRADVARLAGADGVHVGQDDLPAADARRIVGDAQTVGVSTHTQAQLALAIGQPVDYVAIGPIFGTTTKATGYDALGLEMVRAASDIVRASSLPLVAIGGITLDHARAVIDAGAASVAVIGDLLSTGNPEARVRDYLRALG